VEPVTLKQPRLFHADFNHDFNHDFKHDFNHEFLHSGTWLADFNHDFNHDFLHSGTPLLSPVYTIQLVVKPVVKPVWQPIERTVAVRSTRLNEQCVFVQHDCQTGFDNRVDNRLDICLHDTPPPPTPPPPPALLLSRCMRWWSKWQVSRRGVKGKYLVWKGPLLLLLTYIYYCQTMFIGDA